MKIRHRKYPRLSDSRLAPWYCLAAIAVMAFVIEVIGWQVLLLAVRTLAPTGPYSWLSMLAWLVLTMVAGWFSYARVTSYMMYHEMAWVLPARAVWLDGALAGAVGAAAAFVTSLALLG